MGYLHNLKVSFQKIIINYKGEKCTIEIPGRYHLNQVIKVTIPNDTSWHPVPLSVLHWEYITSMEFLPKMLNYEKHQINQNWWPSRKITEHYFSKSTKVIKGKEIPKNCLIRGHSEDTTNKYVTMDWNLGQKKTLVRQWWNLKTAYRFCSFRFLTHIL